MLLDRIPVRFRLSLGHAAWLAVLFLGMGLGFYQVVKKHLYDSVDTALIASARSVRDARFSRGISDTPIEIFFKHFFRDPVYVDEFFRNRLIRTYAQLIDVSGKVQFKANSTNLRINLPVTPNALKRAEKNKYTLESFRHRNGTKLRQVTFPVVKNGKFTGELVQIGTSMEDVTSSLHSIALVLWVALTVGLVMSIFFGYLLAARALRPVRNTTRAAARLGIDDLDVRLPLPEANDELRDLAQTFNGMMDRLEDSVHRIRRFSGDVSHELRTPLSVLRGEAELALRRKRSPEEYERTLRTIVSESSNMTKIIEDLLLLAKAQSHSVAIDWVPLQSDDFVDQIVDSVMPVYINRKVTLKTDIRFKGKFLACQGYLSIAVKNLLLNAAKHSKEHSEVLLKVDCFKDDISFEVTDKGEGISKENLPYIFDSFYRVDTARNRASGGTGLGLSLSLALVRLHEGEITVDSEVGKGSVFTVTIPQKKFRKDIKPKPNQAEQQKAQSLPIYQPS